MSEAHGMCVVSSHITHIYYRVNPAHLQIGVRACHFLIISIKMALYKHIFPIETFGYGCNKSLNVVYSPYPDALHRSILYA